MKSSQEILVEYWYDKVDLDSIKKWVYSYIENNEEAPEEIFDLLDSDEDQVESLLLKLSTKVDSNFSSQSIKAEILAARHLMKIAYKYLNDEATPMDVCRVVNKIDCGFMGASRGLPDNIAYRPDWLGNLYNSCDWCDDSWTNSSAPHLKNELEAQLVKIAKWVEAQLQTNNSKK